MQFSRVVVGPAYDGDECVEGVDGVVAEYVDNGVQHLDRPHRLGDHLGPILKHHEFWLLVCWKTKIAPDRKGDHYLLLRPCVAVVYCEPSAVQEAAARLSLRGNLVPGARFPVRYTATGYDDDNVDGYNADRGTRRYDTEQPLS